ncbi:MAG: transposase [Bacteroidetes bacterium]|nr:transposase [Bacteroidota bacterium]
MFEIIFNKNKDFKTQMTLSNPEFIRRFAIDILPLRFVRIRHYGMLSSTWKRGKFGELRRQLKMNTPAIEVKTKLHCCPHCKTGTLIAIAVFGKRGPPHQYILAQNTISC